MNRLDDFGYGQFVLYDGKVMFVNGIPYDEEDEGYPDKIELIEENCERIYDEEEEMEYSEYILASINDVTILPEVTVNEETLRSFFRMDTTPWKLAAEGKYPFSDNSGSFYLGEDDLGVFLSRLGATDSIVYDEWKEQYVCKRHVKVQKETPDRFTMRMAWRLIRDELEWYDAEEDEPEYITTIWDFYKSEKGKKLDEIAFPEDFKNIVISSISNYAKKNEISDMQKQTYLRLLNEQYDAGDIWAIKHKAYAYYGGNSIVTCDWKIAEEALLKLHDTDTEDAKYAANSLGYIYYSNRLGEPDYVKAFSFFSEAAEYGITEAKYKLADMYRKGHGTPKKTRKAFSIYRKLYDEELDAYNESDFGCNLADVALRMGYCYENGEGVKKDYFKAYEYYQTAKEAITVRIKKYNHFGDQTVKNNIDESLQRIAGKLDKILPNRIKPEEFDGVNMMGRMVYLFMCVEKYLSSLYPEKEWKVVAEHMWPWTEDYWDKGWNIYSKVVPEFLMEFDSYEETNLRDFEGSLNKKEYEQVIALYSDITKGDGESDLDKIMMTPIDFANECEGAGESEAKKNTMFVFNTIAEIYGKNHLRLPDIESVKVFSIKEFGEWGGFADTRDFSIFLLNSKQIATKMKDLVMEKHSINPENSEEIQKIWDKQVKLLTQSLPETIRYLDSIADEKEMSAVAEVWDDISEYWQSEALIICMERCIEKYPSISSILKVDLEYAVKALKKDYHKKDISNYEYLWTTEKDDWVLVNSTEGYGIVNIRTKMMLLIDNDELAEELIIKMIESGNKKYESILDAFGESEKCLPKGEQ